MDEGLVAALGLSNCSLAQVEEVLAAAKHKPACNQVGSLLVESWWRHCRLLAQDVALVIFACMLLLPWPHVGEVNQVLQLLSCVVVH